MSFLPSCYIIPGFLSDEIMSSIIWNIITYILFSIMFLYVCGIYCLGFYVQEASQYLPFLHYFCTFQNHPLHNGDECFKHMI